MIRLLENPKNVASLKLLRDFLHLHLGDAKQLMDSAPVTLDLKNTSPVEEIRFRFALEAAGAKLNAVRCARCCDLPDVHCPVGQHYTTHHVTMQPLWERDYKEAACDNAHPSDPRPHVLRHADGGDQIDIVAELVDCADCKAILRSYVMGKLAGTIQARLGSGPPGYGFVACYA